MSKARLQPFASKDAKAFTVHDKTSGNSDLVIDLDHIKLYADAIICDNNTRDDATNSACF